VKDNLPAHLRHKSHRDIDIQKAKLELTVVGVQNYLHNII